jgi:hypothetical protein
MANSSEDILYHYCSMEAFLGIVQSQTLRLTNMRFMNDSKEISWLYELAKKVLWDKKYRCHTDNERRLCDRLLSHCDDLFLDEAFFPDYNCSCFSLNGDSLSQWRAYADDGRGVAIGFSRKYMESCTSPHRLLLRKARYVDGSDLSAVASDVNTAFSKLNGITRSLTDDEINMIALATFTLWDQEATFVKNAAFQEEAEMRLFFLPHNQVKCPQIGEMGFFCRNTVVVPYYPLGLSLDAGPIAEVVLGPRNRADHNSHAIRMLALANGFTLAIDQFTYSTASYGETRRTQKLYPPPR